MSLECIGNDAEKAVAACKHEIERLDTLFSPTYLSSDIYSINHRYGNTVSVNSETVELLYCAKAVSKATQGVFDITIRPLVELWGFETDSPSVPAAEKIQSCLPLKGESSITAAGNYVFINNGVSVDVGGIAKGYCSDRLKEILDTFNLQGGVFSLGGNILAYKTKQDGSPWNVAVMDPLDGSSYAGILKAENSFVVTSGSYQRCFEENGKVYHHILDPKTGYPADSGLLSVTVVSENGTYADALSTAFFVLGYDGSKNVFYSLKDDMRPEGAIFITKEKTIYILGDIDFTSHGDYRCIEETF